jgi:hypothetical protein
VLAKLAGLETRLEGIERTLGELVVKQQQTPTTTTAGDKQQQK